MSDTNSTATVETAKPAVPNSTTDLPGCIQRHLETVEYERSHLMSLVEIARDAEAVVAQLSDHIPARCWTHGGGCVWVEWRAKSMDEVVEMKRRFAQLGYHGAGHNEYVQDQRITYELKKGALTHEIVLNVRFGVEGAADGATCRFVAVGTKEVPVYALRCGGDKA